MTPHEERKIVSVLDRALSEPVGVELSFLGPDEARLWKQRIHEVRKKMPQFKELIMIHRDHLLWVAKEEIGDGED